MPTHSGHDVGELPWDAVAGRLRDGAAAVLPIGAGAKEHGYHLPLATDRIQAEWLAERLADRLVARGIDLLAWPCLCYGYYPAFVAYPGSVSLTFDTFTRVVAEIAGGLLAAGARTVFVLDTGISTLPAVGRALATIPRTHHLRVHDGARYRAVEERLVEQDYGSHADEAETSRMLALRADLVEMARAEPSPGTGPMPPGALTPDDPTSPNFSPSGCVGDPSRATSEKGTLLLEATLADLEETVAARLTVTADQKSGSS